MRTAAVNRPPGSLAERFWSIAKAVGPSGDDVSDPRAVVRHVLRILDALSAGEVGAGLSQATLSFITLLRQHEANGDLSYASPEQARGETLDERSLVFSVGVLLFEELTGRHPFGAAANPRRIARIQKGEMGSGVQYFPQVPAQLRTVLMKAMGPFPEERYTNLRELRTHLERFAMDTPVPAPKKHQHRPLKGLPPTPADLVFGAGDDMARTQILKRPSPTPPQGEAILTPAGEARPLSREQAAPTIEVAVERRAPELPKPNRTVQILERVGYVVLGGVVSLVISLAVVKRSAPAPVPPSASTPVVTVEPVKPAPPVAAEPVPVANAPKVTPLPEAKPGELPAPGEQLPKVFDLQVAGKNAAQTARQCFAPMDRTVSFGVGLLFSRGDAMARRVFLSPEEPLTPEQRKCLKEALLYAFGGAAPDKTTVAELRLRLRPGDGSKDEIRALLGK